MFQTTATPVGECSCSWSGWVRAQCSARGVSTPANNKSRQLVIGVRVVHGRLEAFLSPFLPFNSTNNARTQQSTRLFVKIQRKFQSCCKPGIQGDSESLQC